MALYLNTLAGEKPLSCTRYRQVKIFLLRIPTDYGQNLCSLGDNKSAQVNSLFSYT